MHHQRDARGVRGCCLRVCSFVRSLARSPHANEERHEPVALDLMRQELPERELVPVDRRHRRSTCHTLLLLLGLSLRSLCASRLVCDSMLRFPKRKRTQKKQKRGIFYWIPKSETPQGFPCKQDSRFTATTTPRVHLASLARRR